MIEYPNNHGLALVSSYLIDCLRVDLMIYEGLRGSIQ